MKIEYIDGNLSVNSILYTKTTGPKYKYSIHNKDVYISFCTERRLYFVEYDNGIDFSISLYRTGAPLHWNKAWRLDIIRGITIEVDCGVLICYTAVEETIFDGMGRIIEDAFLYRYRSYMASNMVV